MHFDPGVYTQIQSSLISAFTTSLVAVTAYSQDLLYLCASIEVVLFALLFAINGSNVFGRLLFTVLKIGFLLMVINEFNTWLALLLNSFNQVAGQSTATTLLNAPGDIWQYAYNSGITLLKAACADHISMGLSLLLTILGIGILLIYGLLGARVIVTIASFYLTALIALLFMPFGILKPTADFAYRGFQSVLKSGVGVLALLFILAAASSMWQNSDFQLVEKFNINQVLGIFFSGLVILLLSQSLPKMAASAIGQVKALLPENTASTTTSGLNASAPAFNVSERNAMQAATTLDSGQNNSVSGGQFSAAAVHIAPNATSGSLAPDMAKSQNSQQRGRFDSATSVAPSISGATLQKLKATRYASGD